MRATRLNIVLLTLALTSCLGRNKHEHEFELTSPVPPPAQLDDALYQNLDVRLAPGQTVRFVDNGAVFDSILDDLKNAKVSVNFATFIWSQGEASDRVIAALRARPKGVRCRVLADAIGSSSFFKDVRPDLEAIGCEVRPFRPIPGQDDRAREHRKLTLIDGRIGYTGGYGIDDRWQGDGLGHGHWRDSNVRVTGPAVAAMQRAFAENWIEAGGDLLPGEDFPPLAPDAEQARKSGHDVVATYMTSTAHPVVTRAERMMQLLILSARKRIWIANAYFVPSNPIRDLLAMRAKDGLDVRVLTPGDTTDTKEYLPQQRSRERELMKSGVKVWEYLPAMMHAKTVLIDDELIAVGSSNLDALSLNHLDEGMVIARDRDLAKQLEAHWAKDLQVARPLSP